MRFFSSSFWIMRRVNDNRTWFFIVIFTMKMKVASKLIFHPFGCCCLFLVCHCNYALECESHSMERRIKWIPFKNGFAAKKIMRCARRSCVRGIWMNFVDYITIFHKPHEIRRRPRKQKNKQIKSNHFISLCVRNEKTPLTTRKHKP